MPSPQNTSIAGSQSPAGVRLQSPRQAGSVRAVSSPQGVGRPRLAIMPSAQNFTVASPMSPPGLRQQSPSMSPRQAGSVRPGASPQGIGRPRLVNASPSVASSQSLVLRSPTQPRAVPPQSSQRLALMPPPQPRVQSPPGTSQPATIASPTKYQLQFVGRQPTPRQQSPAAVKQESSPGLTQHLAQLASQLSSSSVGPHLQAMVEQMSKQQRQQSPMRQGAPTNPPTAVTVPASVQSMQPVPVNLTIAAPPCTILSANPSQIGNARVFPGTVASSTHSPRSSSQPSNDASQLRDLLLASIQSPSRSAAMPTPVVVAQQRTSAPGATIAAASQQAMGHPMPIPHMPHLESHPTIQSMLGIPSTVTNIMSPNVSVTVSQPMGMQSLGVTTQMVTQPGEVMGAFLASPRAPFSPGQPQLASLQQLTAVPLYASPTRAAAPKPPPAALGPAATDDPQQRARGIQPRDLVVPQSRFDMIRASGDPRSVTGVPRMVMQQTSADTKQLMLSPQPVIQASVGRLHQLSQFSPQQQPTSSSQAYLMSTILMDDATRSPQQMLSPLESHRPPVLQLQQSNQGSPQVSSLAQSQGSAVHVHRVNQNPQQVPSSAHGQVTVASVHQKVHNPAQVTSLAHGQVSGASIPQSRPNPEQVTSLQSQMPPAAPQRFVLNPRETTAPAQGQMFPGYVSKWTQNAQQRPEPTSRPQEDRTQKKTASMGQLMQYRHPATASLLSPASLQHGYALPCQQPQLGTSPLSSSKTSRVEVGQSVIRDAGNPASSSQRVGRAVGTDSPKDRLAELEKIKQQACEKLLCVKQPSNAQQIAVTSTPPQVLVALTSARVASMDPQRQVGLTTVPQVTAVQSSSRGGQISVPSIPSQPASAAVSHTKLTATPTDRQHAAVPDHGIRQPEPKLLSTSLCSASPRSTVSSVSGHSVSASTDTRRQASSATSSQSGQVTPPAILQQRQLSEPSPLPPTISSSATSTPRGHPSSTSIDDRNTSAVSSFSATSQYSEESVETQHDAPLTKEKLLELKEKVQKTGSAELDRQKIVSEQLHHLQSNVATAAETSADETESCVSETHVVESSVSSTSVAGSYQMGTWKCHY